MSSLELGLSYQITGVSVVFSWNTSGIVGTLSVMTRKKMGLIWSLVTRDERRGLTSAVTSICSIFPCCCALETMDLTLTTRNRVLARQDLMIKFYGCIQQQ